MANLTIANICESYANEQDPDLKRRLLWCVDQCCHCAAEIPSKCTCKAARAARNQQDDIQNGNCICCGFKASPPDWFCYVCNNLAQMKLYMVRKEAAKHAAECEAAALRAAAEREAAARREAAAGREAAARLARALCVAPPQASTWYLVCSDPSCSGSRFRSCFPVTHCDKCHKPTGNPPSAAGRAGF